MLFFTFINKLFTVHRALKFVSTVTTYVGTDGTVNTPAGRLQKKESSVSEVLHQLDEMFFFSC